MSPIRALLVLALACAGCSKSAAVEHGADEDPSAPFIKDLEHQETALRASTDWATFPASDRTLGPDPIDVAALPGGGGFAGVLRGADALVRLDNAGKELQRLPAPRAPRAIAVSDDTVAVVGELDARVMLVHLDAHGFGGAGFVDVAGVHGLRGVALAAHRIYVVDVDGRLLTLDERGQTLGTFDVGPHALLVRRAGAWLVTMSVLGHTLVALPVDAGGLPDAAHAVTVKNDGPFWGFDARVADGALLVATGHVEDHPLDRRGGSFGYIDSFVTVHRIDAAGAKLVANVNASALGVVVPKALAFLDEKTVLALGAGSGRGLQLDIDTSQTEEVKALPGIAAVAISGNTVLGASPLLDAWVSLDAPPHAVPVPVPSPSARSADSKLGEALVFTTAMAPRQKSDNELSRFTCETCHFEGGGDGRIHATGRGDIVATTKPLQGLFNNKPLFTRAMDEDLAVMVHAEFRVANANSTLDPWFALTPADAPWLALLGVSGTQAPIDLRRSLMTFLHDFTPRTNAAVAARGAQTQRAFTDEERRGAKVFAARCASCHTPRLVGDDEKTAQPFDKWESLVLADNGPLVWSGDGRVKDGIEPYVHEEGARPTSLRRIARKHPYFVNGSSPTLADVVARARFDGSTFLHSSNRSPTELQSLSPEDQRSLVAFLQLL